MNIVNYVNALKAFDGLISRLETENRVVTEALGDGSAVVAQLESLPDGKRLAILHAIVQWAIWRYSKLVPLPDPKPTDAPAPVLERTQSRRQADREKC